MRVQLVFVGAVGEVEAGCVEAARDESTEDWFCVGSGPEGGYDFSAATDSIQ